MIFIRKIYDFELLTAINLIYLYGNPIIKKEINIVPTMIKVSELNCIYITIYNLRTKKSFIRGYNLNGLYFAQTKEDDYMNICFTKNGNLLSSIYGKDKISILNCYDLNSVDNNSDDNFNLSLSEFLNNYYNKNKKEKKDENNDQLVWFEYYYKNQEFILLFKDKIIKTGLTTKENRIKMDYY